MEIIPSFNVMLEDRRIADPNGFLRFLRDEGLDLLAAYRSIEDKETRASLLDLVQRVAGTTIDGDNGPVAA